MVVRTSWRLAAVAAIGVLAAGSFPADADAQDKRVRWKMHSAFSGKLAILGPAGPRMEKRLDAMSGGTFNLKFFEPGALVPALQYYDPIAQGSVDAGWGAGGFYVAKHPAYAFFSSVPFGPGLGEYAAWMAYGGGDQLRDEMHAANGIRGFTCGILSPEASGWFRKEIKSVDDLRGLKMRFYGLGARVMEKFGVSTQLLAPGDIYPALELGTIDATELSLPLIDEGLGFHQVAKHYYFPGWHQQTTFADMLVNRAAYDKLSEAHRAMFEAMCNENMILTYTESEAKQFGAMQRLVEKGVTLHTWPDETLKKFETAWLDVASEEAAKDPVTRKIWESYSKFRTDYAIWKDRGYLK